MVESTIAYHCGPALAGIKPSNIVSLKKTKDIYDELNKLNNQLNRKDIYFKILCEYGRCILVMVYRRKKLLQYLEKSEISEFLTSMGYPDDSDEKIEYLKSKIDCKNFPHEIGAFLGYPLHDIYGFMNHKKEGCLLTGEWKVYKNVNEAKELFRKYKICRKALLKRIESGKTLAQVFCAA